MKDALGMIEVIGLIPAIAAADSALKAANVYLLGQYKVGSGIVAIALSGDVGAVTAAVEAATATAKRLGVVRSAHIIARLSPQVEALLVAKEPEQPTPPPAKNAPQTISKIQNGVSLRLADFMRTIPLAAAPVAVDAEGMVLSAEPSDAQRSKVPVMVDKTPPLKEMEKPGSKRTKRKKATEEKPSET